MATMTPGALPNVAGQAGQPGAITDAAKRLRDETPVREPMRSIGCSSHPALVGLLSFRTSFDANNFVQAAPVALKDKPRKFYVVRG